MLRYKRYTCLFCLVALAVGCSPTVRVEAPREPITINMNIKIEHQIRVKIDREIDQVLSEDSGLF
ncbi:YnbE family lipoprotein [Desulfolithobacter sp.]